ncbi:MAG: ComEA family DNA-binding protein [Bacteroidales bacterium]
MKKRFFKVWNTFSNGEKKGIITLSLIIFILIFIPYLYHFFPKESEYSDIGLLREYAKQLSKTQQVQYDLLEKNAIEYKGRKEVKKTDKVFSFDPNNISLDSLILLGFSLKQATAIVKYRERGAVFRTVADFLKVQVITERQRNRLSSYVQIQDTLAIVSTRRDTGWRKKEYTVVELNSADTAALRSLSGIGDYLAKKIVAYREQLGGYYEVQQLLEIQYVKEEFLERHFNRLSVDTTQLKQFSLKPENIELMRRHPYIGAYAARGIVQYAKRKGSVPNLDELRQHNILTSKQVEKLRVYVK